MKKIMISLFSLLIIVAIVGTLIVTNNQKKELQSTVTKQEIKIEKQKQQIESRKEVSGMEITPEEVKFVTDFFNEYLNYDNESYKNRFNNLKETASQEVLSKLQGASSLEPPVVKMKSELTKQQVFVNPAKPHEFLVYVHTSYKLEGSVVNQGYQLYQVNVNAQDNQYIIDDFIVKGNVDEVDGV